MTRHVLVVGPPTAGKSTWARAQMRAGDVLYDFDLLHDALAQQGAHNHDANIKPLVFAMRDALFSELVKPGALRAWVISSAPTKAKLARLIERFDPQIKPMVLAREDAHKRADAAGRPAVWHTYIDAWYDANDWQPDDYADRLYSEARQMPAAVIERVQARGVNRGVTMRGNDGVERRDMALLAELRVNGETGAPVVEGYAAVFDSLSEVLFEWDSGRFRERVAPGAFAKTLREQNIPLLVEHAQLPLATTGSGTLALREDGRGLHFVSELEPSDPDVARLVPKMRRGDLNRCSFGFIPIRQSWDDTAKPRVRTLHEVKLMDVSIVARPAYPATEAKVRKALADDGLDAEMIVELLVRLRQGLPLDADDLLMMRRLADTCQRHMPDTTTAAETAPDIVHPVDASQPVTPPSAPDSIVHPLAWYKEQITRLGV